MPAANVSADRDDSLAPTPPLVRLGSACGPCVAAPDLPPVAGLPPEDPGAVTTQPAAAGDETSGITTAGVSPGPRLIRTIEVRNLLSFGPETPSLELGGLNVLIGPNGSGKSNLLDALSLLQAAPGDLQAAFRAAGGPDDWLWKGGKSSTGSLKVELEVVDDNDFSPDEGFGSELLFHHLVFRRSGTRMGLDGEQVGVWDPALQDWETHLQRSLPLLGTTIDGHRTRMRDPDPDLSILAQLRDPDRYPRLHELSRLYGSIRLYRNWSFGRTAVLREPQRADLRSDRLEEDFSLGLFLNRLRRHPREKQALLDSLRDLYEGVTDFDVSVEGNTVQVFLTEGEFVIPATRLSDGTIRYLCLLAILLDPKLPGLIALEEPELGLHPDIIPRVADLLVAASQRTQLIVTTHSDILVDALTEHPEAIIVCEKHAGQTSMRRLNAVELRPWLDRYRLGELWTRGELGGTRW